MAETERRDLRRARWEAERNAFEACRERTDLGDRYAFAFRYLSRQVSLRVDQEALEAALRGLERALHA